MTHYDDDGVPFFSVIIPTYNSASTISRCLTSVLQQTYKRFEVLVIDGFSRDSTVAIVNHLMISQPQIRLLTEKDEGIYDAMNKGIVLARGRWLFFLGSDDIFFDDAVLEEIKDAIDIAPKSRFIYGNVLTSTGYTQKFEHFSFARLTEKNICHQAIFYHASVFRDERYDTRFRLLADWDFNLKVFRKKNSPTYIDRVITVYNMEGESAGWLLGDEYKLYFSDRKVLFLRHRGRIAYSRFWLNDFLWRLKRWIKEVLRKVLLWPADGSFKLL